MLKNRIITAAILIPIFLLILFKTSINWFLGITGVIVVLAAWEWSQFLGLKRPLLRLIYPVFIASLLWAAYSLPVVYVLYVTFAWWLLALLLVAIYPKGRAIWDKKKIGPTLMGVMVLVPAWMALNFIRVAENGPSIILFIMVLVWSADTAAYFVGKKWGRHLLAPNVSPAKSWEGLGAAVAAAFILALAMLFWMQPPHAEWLWDILLSVVTILFSVVGDLFESMLKRNIDLKDSGKWLPGHGGILDRIDSLTAAAPIFVIGAIWIWTMLH